MVDLYGNKTFRHPEKSFRPNLSFRKKRLQLGSGEHPCRVKESRARRGIGPCHPAPHGKVTKQTSLQFSR
jgi:hypothetical protein